MIIKETLMTIKDAIRQQRPHTSFVRLPEYHLAATFALSSTP